jgi:hypothetical protein
MDHYECSSRDSCDGARDEAYRLANLLSKLIAQIEIADFRDAVGHPLKSNVHYVAAKEAVWAKPNAK